MHTLALSASLVFRGYTASEIAELLRNPVLALRRAVSEEPVVEVEEIEEALLRVEPEKIEPWDALTVRVRLVPYLSRFLPDWDILMEAVG